MGPGAKLVGTDANGNKYYERMTEQYGMKRGRRGGAPPRQKRGGRGMDGREEKNPTSHEKLAPFLHTPPI